MMVTQHSVETLRKRLLWTRLWKVAVIAWSLIRTVIIWAALGGYGFNPWIYLCIDLLCSWGNAVTTPHMVLRFIDGHYTSAINWAILTLIGYIVPDIYIFAGTNTLPLKVIVVLAVVIVAMTALAVVGVVRKILKGRAVLAITEALAGGVDHG